MTWIWHTLAYGFAAYSLYRAMVTLYAPTGTAAMAKGFLRPVFAVLALLAAANAFQFPLATAVASGGIALGADLLPGRVSPEIVQRTQLALISMVMFFLVAIVVGVAMHALNGGSSE